MFYTAGVDIASPKSMWNFLKNHFTYYTMNSWNHLSTIANNVKLYNLELDGSWNTALCFLLDGNDCGDLQWQLQEMISSFNIFHPGYRVYFNGRSNGYLTLCNKENNRSVLPDCVENCDTYEEFKYGCKEYGESVKDYLYELRKATELVRDFDKLCDELRDLVNEYSKMNYKESMLEYHIGRFNEEYASDLELLGFESLEVVDGKVAISEVSTLSCLMETLLHKFDEVGFKVDIEDNFLYVEED
jgi:hypothetical protein